MSFLFPNQETTSYKLAVWEHTINNLISISYSNFVTHISGVNLFFYD